jgi:cysteinyl-tRNA synthetase
LRHLGHRVTYVQNLTDIDDRILQAAARLEIDWQALSENNTGRFLSDMHWLGNLAPTIFPRVSDLIPSIVEKITMLIERRCAYRRDGSVYFKEPSRRGLRAGQRVPDDESHGGRHAESQRDVVLWQAEKPGEPAWESPWGMGRPGRHIECTAIASKFLGPNIDIIGGSENLIFPHHECILAHAECLDGKNPARHWIHTGSVNPPLSSDRSDTANVLHLQRLRQWDGLVIRAAILGRHYAERWDFDPSDIRMAQESVELFRLAGLRANGPGPAIDPGPMEESFHAAMNDNLDMPRAMGVLRRTAIEIMRDSSTDAGPAQAFLNRALSVIGLQLDPIDGVSGRK